MKSREAFTLVELVVVILILGILAAVAAPKLLSTAGTAKDNGLRQTLSIIRDAIEMYAAENGGQLPAADGSEATFKNDLQSYLRKFPKNPVAGDPSEGAVVIMEGGGLPLSGLIDAGPGWGSGWIYEFTTGEFLANTDALSNDGVTLYSQF